MKSNLSLNEGDRLVVGRILNLLLAREYVLYAAARDCLRNVTGPDLPSLRERLAADCRLIAGWIDDIGGQAGAIGVAARGQWIGLPVMTHSAASLNIAQTAGQMFAELLSLHDWLLMHLRCDREICAIRFRDDGMARFFADLVKQHEHAAASLRAELEPEFVDLLGERPHNS